jgi:hypothetical protein
MLFSRPNADLLPIRVVGERTKIVAVAIEAIPKPKIRLNPLPTAPMRRPLRPLPTRNRG